MIKVKTWFHLCCNTLWPGTSPAHAHMLVGHMTRKTKVHKDQQRTTGNKSANSALFLFRLFVMKRLDDKLAALIRFKIFSLWTYNFKVRFILLSQYTFLRLLYVFASLLSEQQILRMLSFKEVLSDLSCWDNSNRELSVCSQNCLETGQQCRRSWSFHVEGLFPEFLWC